MRPYAVPLAMLVAGVVLLSVDALWAFGVPW